ncbi:hypothetical protein C5E22_14185 [Pectobacterium parmentieri]|uniref:Uncharacterized protein n=1 Tax=Pectobacterium parmentieri TaxID=1905730 RepID=A0A8B3FRH0_PECPM|nr:hypothetical protein C5E24_08615 [Pectobacterium parmentieri]AYH19554.1 hypothetical protein C5E22_14185 [Pectobacterium parmentieri]AYH36057.1 hypothetical protein C5E17_08565 [Pectobacterium parmentieri]AZS56161.1 hypothetical protein C5E18_08560 [Pectobacterium parmentieri]RKO75743.1 hypothetical protein C5E00_02580 [Pectobacterium parmentieri]
MSFGRIFKTHRGNIAEYFVLLSRLRRLIRRFVLQALIYFVLINERDFYIVSFFKKTMPTYTLFECVGSTDGCLPQAKSKTKFNINPGVFLTKN